ncbi:MAG TPA: SpoIIIAH-like family protein, partial [Lachnospira eligens]|nr:SpoIIIAH-like family protein [Lachnospira eligens]
MKKIKKNHIIITALAIMIAAAGYINYAGDLDNIIKVKDKEKAAAVVSDNVSIDTNVADDIDTDFTDEPGTVILTSAGVKSEAVAAAKLNREQVRASSIENLKNIADDAGIADDAKKSAIDQLAKLEDNADKETAIELLLSAKGFDSSVVTVSDTNADA